MKVIKILSIVMLGLSFSSCTEFIFEDTQPKGFIELTSFPDFLAGEFIGLDDSTNPSEESISIGFHDKQTIEILSYDKKEKKYSKCILDLKNGIYQDEDMFGFEPASGQLVMKEIGENFYCLNFQNFKDKNLWSVLTFRLLENDDLELQFSIQSSDFEENGAYYEGITDYRKAPKEISEEGVLLNPSPFEFITLAKTNDFFETMHLRKISKD